MHEEDFLVYSYNHLKNHGSSLGFSFSLVVTVIFSAFYPSTCTEVPNQSSKKQKYFGCDNEAKYGQPCEVWQTANNDDDMRKMR